MLKKTLLLLIISALLVTPALAGDTDPNGTQLKAVVEDYLKNAPPDDEDANRLKAAGGANGVIDNEFVTVAVCTWEVMTGVGAIIWESRRNADECGTRAGNVLSYCATYTDTCDHWVWDPDCLKKNNCGGLP